MTDPAKGSAKINTENDAGMACARRALAMLREHFDMVQIAASKEHADGTLLSVTLETPYPTDEDGADAEA